MEIKENSTEAKIIESTFKILQEEGVEKATTKRIAEEAGFNEVTIFRKFKTKQNLINISKEYHLDLFKKKLDELFDFREDEEFDDYITTRFYRLLEFSDSDFSVIKVAMEEVRDIPGKKHLISDITDVIFNRLNEFYALQVEKGRIRELDPKVLSLMSFCLMFQSSILCRVYSKDADFEMDYFADMVVDILSNGVKP